MKVSCFVVFALLINNIFYSEQIPISVIIPCEKSHVCFLPSLLNALTKQSLLPTEVVVSVSRVDNQANKQIDLIEDNTFPYRLKIIRSEKPMFAGDNRNIAIKNSTGELIVCQDADDLPHWQRIEIIRKVYEKTHFDFLLHLHRRDRCFAEYFQPSVEERYEVFNQSNFLGEEFETIKINKAEKAPGLRKRLIKKEIHFGNCAIHFGNCAFKRTIFKDTQYSSRPSGQDVEFYDRIVKKFDNNLVLTLPLVYYISSRSTREYRSKKALEYRTKNIALKRNKKDASIFSKIHL